MPNWKKIVVSGSDATLNSLFVSNAVTASRFSGSFTGSLFGTASYVTGSVFTSANPALSASYALTASYALNGGGGGAITVADEGAAQGTATFLNFIGNGVQAVVASNTASITISGGSATGSVALHTQAVAANTWSFVHNLGNDYPVIDVWDSNGFMIIPGGVKKITQNSLEIYFDIAQTGYASAVVGGVAVSASVAVSSSYALTASYALNSAASQAFPYTGSARITGSLNVIGPTTVTGSILVTQSYISTVDWIDFNIAAATPPHSEGRIHWNIDAKTLELDTDVNNFMIPVGHASVIRGRNTNSFTLTKGTVVFINGNSGQFPTFATASWENDPNSAYTIGIVAQDINTNQYGYAVTDGEIRGINTNAYAPSTLLYLSASGQYTDQVPVAPLHTVRLGQVVVQSTDGILQVKIDNGYELNELHDVLAQTTFTGDLLVRSGSLWINSKQLTGSYGLTGSLTVTGSIRANGGFTGSLIGTSSWAQNAVTASFVTLAQSASYVSGSIFTSANPALSASFATTASFASNGGVTSFNTRTGAVTLQASDISNLGAGIVSASAFSSPSQGTLRAVINGVQTDVDLGLQTTDNVTFGQVTGSNALFSGTITAQTLVVQTVTSSVDFVTGSTRFGTLLTDTHRFTGSVSITGSFSVTGVTTINTQQNATINTGTSVVATVSTASAYAAFFDYVARSGSATQNLRAGTITSVWNTTGTAEYTDVSTVDIGNTAGVTLAVVANGANAELRATVTTDSWNIKTFVRAI